MTLAAMVDGHWLPVKDGDDRARALYLRHYSGRHYLDRVRPAYFVGPGEKMVLLNFDCTALYVWKRNMIPLDQRSRYPRQDRQAGVFCSVFRNESPILSSDLIREAMDLAWRRWPGERLFTYVNPAKIRSTNPGACFKYAGWRCCGMSKGGLVILECLPEEVAT
jgi:hypothetical protein